MYGLNIEVVHNSWKPMVENALGRMDPLYLNQLQDQEWLPGADNIFKAFSLPLHQVRYVLFGESPYPREASANGYAFWDDAVTNIWSSSGLSKMVNRATSLRNFIKMLLISEGVLSKNNVSQSAIESIPKEGLVQSNAALFNNLLRNGFLLMNASLVLHHKEKKSSVSKDAKYWSPFMKSILIELVRYNPDVQFLLFGKIANSVNEWISDFKVNTIEVEHPYNVSFITNTTVLNFFSQLHLLKTPEVVLHG